MLFCVACHCSVSANMFFRLIEKDYMERDESKDGRNAYSYLA